MLLAELKGDGSGPAEDKTPLMKDEEIDEITEEDYFIKNAEVAPLPHQHEHAFRPCSCERHRHLVEVFLTTGALLTVS